MSGLELYGALTATAGLIKVALEVKDYFDRTAERLRALEQAETSELQYLISLGTLFQTLASTFKRVKDDIATLTSRKDQSELKGIIRGIEEAIQRCRKTASSIRVMIEKRNFRSTAGFDVLRQTLDSQVAIIQTSQVALNMCISSATLRCVKGDYAARMPCDPRKPLNQRDSELENLPSTSRRVRNDSTSSMQTLTPASSSSSNSTHSTGSSSGFNSNSRDPRSFIALVESEQLRSAVKDNDIAGVKEVIGQPDTESEKRSWKASALYQACSFRRLSIVRSLLSSNADVTITDKSGLGVMHATIGKTEQLSEVKERETADILRLLVHGNCHSPLLSSTDNQKQQPLHYCAMTGNYSAAQYLLSVNSNAVNAEDSKKRTPLYHICEHHSPNKKLVKLFLSKGGDFGPRNRPTRTDNRFAKINRMLDDAAKIGKPTLNS